MTKYANFTKFARDLYLHSNETPIQIKELDKLDRSPFMDRAVQVLDLFALAHSTKFGRVFKKTLSSGIKTEKDFMKFSIPKCLKLYDEERYFFSLMLVVGFLADLEEYLHLKKGCHLFVQSGYKCLVAVFNRRFKAAFNGHGGFGGLDIYFSSILSGFTGENKFEPLDTILNDGREDLKLKVSCLISNCHDPMDVDFALNDFERSIATDFQATKKEWFDPDTVDDYSSEQDKSTSTNATHVNYACDAEENHVESICDDSFDCLDSFSLPFSEEISDFESSWSESYEPDLDNVLESVAAYKLRLENPDLYDRKMSSVQCQFCGEKCYQYAKYIIRKHCQLITMERKAKWKLVLWKLALRVNVWRKYSLRLTFR